MSIPTPLEASGGPYTTHPDEIAFYNALAAASPRFAYESIGKSARDGRAMWLIRIGAASPPEPGDTDSVLFTACQHGNEFAARETAIRFIRDMVFTTDPVMVNYLAEHPIFIMPTCNPDQIEDQQRNNGMGQNINRDHLRLRQGEALAIAEAIYQVNPTIVYDIHEYHTTTQHNGTSVRWMMPIPPSHPQIGAPTRHVGQVLFDRIGAEIIDNGYTFGLYNFASITLPTMLCNAASLIHGMPAFTPETPTSGPLATRMTVHGLGIDEVIEYHRTKSAEIRAFTAQSIADKIREGELARKAFSLMDSEVVLAPPPAAYWITEAQYAAIADHRRLFRLVTIPDDDGYLIPMGQQAQPAIPLMFDPESPYVVEAGERVYTLPSAVEADSWGPIRFNGLNCPVTLVDMQVDGRLRRIWQP